MTSGKKHAQKQLCNNNHLKNQAQIYQCDVNNAKIYSNIRKTDQKTSYTILKFSNEIFVSHPASLIASLTTGNDLPPKPLVLWSPFFLRVKVISIHMNLYCSEKFCAIVITFIYNAWLSSSLSCESIQRITWSPLHVILNTCIRLALLY